MRRLTLTAAMAAALLLPITANVTGDVEPDRAAVPIFRPGVGRLVAIDTVTDIDGKAHPVNGPVVIVMTSPVCPLSKRYAPVLARLSRTETLIFVDVNGADAKGDFREFAKTHGFRGVLVHDPERALAKKLGATTTTEAFLLDAKRTLVYRGAVDDQYGIGTARDSARRSYLVDALAAMRAGKAPSVRSTSSPGCALGLDPTPARETTLTWHGTTQRIVQANCAGCHRKGGIAPFALETYEQVKANAEMMKFVIKEGIMPPWFAKPKTGGPWANDRSLPDQDRKDLVAWLGSKKHPKGDPAHAPAPRKYPDEWTIGKPDAVIELSRDVAVKAEGKMPYVNIRVKTGFTEDKWVRGWEVRPTARDVVHHVLVFVVPPGRRRPSRDRDGFFAAYVPGNASAIYPAGLGKRIPAGSSLYFQLHYTPTGKAKTDRTRIGLLFTDKPKNEVHTIGVVNPRIRIPPGTANHVERATLHVPWDATVLALMPHMHYRGKSFKFELVKGKSTKTLLDVPRYDFNWQLAYLYRKPLLLKKGSLIRVTATYDNSAENEANPDPDKTVRWGLQSTDEMLIGYLTYYIPTLPAGEPLPRVANPRALALLRLLDRNGDGRVHCDECPLRYLLEFAKLDDDGNGYLDIEEVTDAKLNDLRKERD